MSVWMKYENNPKGRKVGDCAVRAVSKAIGSDWEKAYAELAVMGFTMGDMPSSNSVIDAVLRQYGFRRQAIQNSCPDCYTFSNFADDHPKGTYVVGTGNHVACIENGAVWDSWDSGMEIPIFYWEEEPEMEPDDDKEVKRNGV